ncbi:hypothetical protein Tco_0502437 [Tanacetum coccineum]
MLVRISHAASLWTSQLSHQVSVSDFYVEEVFDWRREDQKRTEENDFAGQQVWGAKKLVSNSGLLVCVLTHSRLDVEDLEFGMIGGLIRISARITEEEAKKQGSSRKFEWKTVMLGRHLRSLLEGFVAFVFLPDVTRDG